MRNLRNTLDLSYRILYTTYIFFMFLHYNSFQSPLAEPSVLSQHMYGSTSFFGKWGSGGCNRGEQLSYVQKSILTQKDLAKTKTFSITSGVWFRNTFYVHSMKISSPQIIIIISWKALTFWIESYFIFIFQAVLYTAEGGVL